MNLNIDIARLAPTFDSAAEEWWHKYGTLLLTDRLGEGIALTQYHAFTLHLPGGSYTPDFLHVTSDGRMLIVEVKGSTKQRNYRDARSKLRAAAELYRWAVFYEVIVTKGGCEKIEEIGSGG